MKNKITIIKAILVAVCFFTFGNLFSQSQGPNGPANVTEQYYGCLACTGADWSAMANTELSDNTFTVSQMSYYPHCINSSCYDTKALMPTKYNFNIPNNATILGIKVQIQKKGSNPSTVVDTVVELLKGGVEQTNYNASLAGFWTLTDSTYYYGDSTNLWGNTWTPSDINDTTFGVYFIAQNQNPNNVAAFVDYVGVTVYYSLPSGEIMLSSSDNSMNIILGNNQNLIITTSLDKAIPNSTLQIYNVLGQKMFTKEFNNLPKGFSKQELTIGTLPEGIYFTELVAGENKFLKKIIVNR